MTVDQDLRARFASLRQHTEERAPAFEAVLARAPARRARPIAWALAGGCALVMVTVALLEWPSRPGPPTDIPETSLLDWKSPTDFLLDTPEQAFLRAVPDFGEFPQPITEQRIALPEVVS